MVNSLNELKDRIILLLIYICKDNQRRHGRCDATLHNSLQLHLQKLCCSYTSYIIVTLQNDDLGLISGEIFTRNTEIMLEQRQA